MNAKKCDRCGKFYDVYDYNLHKHEHGNSLTIWNIQINNYEERIKSFDLCKPCMAKLEEFLGMNEEKENNDEKGYT